MTTASAELEFGYFLDHSQRHLPGLLETSHMQLVRRVARRVDGLGGLSDSDKRGSIKPALGKWDVIEQRSKERILAHRQPQLSTGLPNQASKSQLSDGGPIRLPSRHVQFAIHAGAIKIENV
jgi:hypothetical protein